MTCLKQMKSLARSCVYLNLTTVIENRNDMLNCVS